MSRLMMIALVLLLAACGTEAEQADAPGMVSMAVTGGDAPAAGEVDAVLVGDLLGRIDADTAILWLSLEAVPQPLLDQIWDSVGEMSDAQREGFAEMTDGVDEPLLRALLAELEQLDSPEAYAERGLDANGVGGLHLAGIFPMLHWELSDQQAFIATLERIEEEADSPMPRRQVGDEEVIWIEFEELGLAIHHDANFMSLGLIADREELLRRVANLEQPAVPLAREEVDAFSADRGYSQNNFGFLDFQRLLTLLMDGDDELLEAARSEGRLGEVATDPACRTELEALTRLFPRKSFGTTEFDEHALAMSLRLETHNDLGQRLSALADSPVALTPERAGVATLGLAINIVAARDFGREIVAGWVDNPPQCSLFANIAENASGWQLALNRPIPPLVTNLHGARIHLDQFSLSEGMPSDVTGTLAVFMRNPQMMLGMAQMFSPELAALELTPGGEPQPLPPGLVPNLEDTPAWLGLGESGIGLAVGAGQDSALPTALVAGNADSAIWSMGLDLAAYAELIEAGIEALPDQTPDGVQIDASEATESLLVLSALYSYMDKSIHLTPAGIDTRLKFHTGE